MTSASTVVNFVSKVSRWIADTGASMDFIGKNKLPTFNKAKAIKPWEEYSKKFEKERVKRKIFHIPDEEIQRYNNLLAKVRNDLSAPAAPVMPVFKSSKNKSAGGAKHTGTLAGSKKEKQKPKEKQNHCRKYVSHQ